MTFNKNLPFSLPELMSEAHAAAGYTSQEVTTATNSLYDKNLITYPRTLCPYLPEEMFGESLGILANLYKSGNLVLVGVEPGSIRLSEKSTAWNSKNTLLHHAIIPTSLPAKGLTEIERDLYQFISARFVQQFINNDPDRPDFKSRFKEKVLRIKFIYLALFSTKNAI